MTLREMLANAPSQGQSVDQKRKTSQFQRKSQTTKSFTVFHLGRKASHLTKNHQQATPGSRLAVPPAKGQTKLRRRGVGPGSEG